MSQGAADREFSRRQGLYTTSNTAALALAAGVSGFLFSINPAIPFTAVAAASALFALTTLYWWRRVPGHVTTLAHSGSGRVEPRTSGTTI
jgi:hypothetical protein